MSRSGFDLGCGDKVSRGWTQKRCPSLKSRVQGGRRFQRLRRAAFFAMLSRLQQLWDR